MLPNDCVVSSDSVVPDDSVVPNDPVLPDGCVLPDYNGAALCNLLPSAVAALGLAELGLGESGAALQLPSSRQICVLLIDGLGCAALHEHRADAPVLGSMLAGEHPRAVTTYRDITAGFPSTTGASLASIGTGLPPSQHGLVGYRVLIPERGRLMSLLQWDDSVDPSDWQPHPTIFEQLNAAGVVSAHVASPDFAASGLTRSSFRGANYIGAATPGELIAALAATFGQDGPRLIFGYYPDLDKTGHGQGVNSPAWRHQLAVTDRMVERLVTELPPDVTLVITGDHGMVDVEPSGKLDLDSAANLLDGVALLGGEARARHVYTAPGAAGDVLAAWRESLPNVAWVVSKAQAIEEQWFGPGITDMVARRLGDVIAAALPGSALVATVKEERQSALRGMHGSLTTAEQLIPLLTVQTQ